MLRLVLELTLTIALSQTLGCAYGPKAERKTPLSYLSGESYETGDSGSLNQLVVPVLKRKEQSTSIEGQVLIGQGITSSQLRNVKVGLFGMDGKLVAMSTTGEGGQFQIHTPIRNGRYRLKLISDHYEGELPIEVSTYEQTNLSVYAKLAPYRVDEDLN